MQQTKFQREAARDDLEDYPGFLGHTPTPEPAEPPPCVLEGFRLLDLCKVEFPEHAVICDASSINATSVVEEDLYFYSQLRVLDASRNQLPFAPLSAFPALQELRLACNGVRELGPLDGRFQRLRSLDLSYNAVPLEAVVELAKIPFLQELDLTCNRLTHFPGPEVLRDFGQLERLCLERNQIEDPELLVSLSSLPRLQVLYLGYNYLTGFPREAAAPGGFPCLHTLNLAFNYITSEDELVPVVHLHKLETLVLYGNPLLGPTGEDPSGESIDYLAQCLLDVRTGYSTRALDILTEKPKKKTAERPPASAAEAMRRSKYRNVSIREVDEDVLPTASEFRAAGTNKLLAGHKKRRQPRTRLSKDALWNRFIGGNSRPDKAEVDGGDPALTFMTGVDVPGTDEDDRGGGGYDAQGAGAGFVQEKRDPGERVPVTLFGKPVERTGKGDPGKLRAAMTALRFSLAHPMTAHEDEAPGGRRAGWGEPFANRPTAAARLRQLPRRAYQPRDEQPHETFGQAIAKKKEARRMMDTIEAELDALNGHSRIMHVATRELHAPGT